MIFFKGNCGNIIAEMPRDRHFVALFLDAPSCFINPFVRSFYTTTYASPLDQSARCDEVLLHTYVQR